jgi:DNA-binding MarR family transcriptional regulator
LFVLTNRNRSPYVRDMTIAQAVQVVQMTYPQVYLFCHSRHQRKRSTVHRLSARDAAILAHLDPGVPMTPRSLAKHLGVARSTLSEALKRLEALGYVGRPRALDPMRGPQPKRRDHVVLTALGAQAVSDTSVLETPRLRAALAAVTARERAAIAAGMEALAQACRAQADSWPRTRLARQ